MKNKKEFKKSLCQNVTFPWTSLTLQKRNYKKINYKELTYINQRYNDIRNITVDSMAIVVKNVLMVIQ